jgi:hypothetical protein
MKKSGFMIYKSEITYRAQIVEIIISEPGDELSVICTWTSDGRLLTSQQYCPAKKHFRSFNTFKTGSDCLVNHPLKSRTTDMEFWFNDVKRSARLQD